MSTPRFADELTLAATGTAISNARRFVACTLARWRAGHILDDALQVVTELVTDAVRATGMLDVDIRWSEVEYLNLITVRLVGLEVSIRIEVWDSSPNRPVVPDTADSAVKRGCYPTAGGKVVWYELEIPERSSAVDRTQELPLVLPQRKRRPQPEPSRPVATERNPELLRRVIEGLGRLDD